MKNFYIFIFLFLLSCSSYNKTFMCGDRECVDKREYKSYFEKNLTIEMKISNKKEKKSVNLVELNSKVIKKEKTKKNIFSKTFKNQDKKEIKEQKKLAKIKEKELIKIRKKQIKAERKKTKKLIKLTKLKNKEKENQKLLNKPRINKNDNKLSKKINETNTKEICNILKNCNIDEITNLLLKKGTAKDFPDITTK